jgi:hypothetical protein
MLLLFIILLFPFCVHMVTAVTVTVSALSVGGTNTNARRGEE